MTTIAQERQRLIDIQFYDLIKREDWGARFDHYYVARSVEEPADTQHVHITITNPGNYTTDAAHARGVEAIGIARFPSTGVSYNRGFMQSGKAYEFQPIGRRGAHTVNDFRRATCSTSGCPGRGGSLRAPSWNNNITGRAYVICQNVGDAVTDKQLDAMARCMAADRLAGFVRRDAKIHGHRCCSSKSCPGDRMWRRMGELRQLVDHYVRVGFGETLPDTGGDDDMTPDQMTAWANSPEGKQALAGALAGSGDVARQIPNWTWHSAIPGVPGAPGYLAFLIRMCGGTGTVGGSGLTRDVMLNRIYNKVMGEEQLDEAQIVALLVPQLTEAFAAALPEDATSLTKADVESVVRAVLGGLDEQD